MLLDLENLSYCPSFFKEIFEHCGVPMLYIAITLDVPYDYFVHVLNGFYPMLPGLEIELKKLAIHLLENENNGYEAK